MAYKTNLELVAIFFFRQAPSKVDPLQPRALSRPDPKATVMMDRLISTAKTGLSCFAQSIRLRDLVHFFLGGNHVAHSRRMALRNLLAVIAHQAKNSVRWGLYSWQRPVAAKACRKAKRISEKQDKLIKNGTATKELLTKANIQIVRLMLRAVFDDPTIDRISNSASRMGLCDIVDGKATFSYGLNPDDVIRLMHEGVSAVCLSYKHTRKGREDTEGLKRDAQRVTNAVERAAIQLSQDRLLFWCDVIGRRNEDSWAAQGVNPYLAMPTLRLESAELEEQIEDSFWMTVERIAALWCGGMFTFNEDSNGIIPWPRNDKEMILPSLDFPFEMAKVGLAKMICNPILYYRRARCESDKLEVMKYALYCATSVHLNVFPLAPNKDGMFELHTPEDWMAFVSVSCIELTISPSCCLNRPKHETIVAKDSRWHGIEEMLPALKLLDSQTRQLLSRKIRKGALEVRRLSCNDGVSDLLCRPVFPINLYYCSTMRLRVQDFMEHEDYLTGRVVSFRVASEDEEHYMTTGKNVRKQICFH